MIENNRIQVLISEINKSLSVLARIDEFYRSYLGGLPAPPQRSTEQAIVVSEVLVNSYTCLETVFLRISQFFENTLAQEKWHQDLLHKMALEIEGVRERVISDETAAILAELLKFRHFKRYYFEFNYDWDRLNFLQKKYEQLDPLIKQDLQRFLGFLTRLAEPGER